MKDEQMALPEGKLGLFWLIGALALTGGAWLLGGQDISAAHIFMAFILILFAGLSWIGVSVGVAHRNR